MMSKIKKRGDKWFVLITKPKSEKKVAAQLNQIGIHAYCPIRTEVRQWSDRKKKVEVPLLPSMILVHINEAERPHVYAVNGIKRYFYWLGKAAKVTNEEVEILKTVENKTYTSIKTEALQVGSTINLKAFGMPSENGTVKYISENQCWLVLNSIGHIIKLQIKDAKVA